MKIIINAENIELNDQIREYIDEKIGKELNRLLNKISNVESLSANVTINKRSRWGFKVKFDALLPIKEHIFAEAINKDLLACLTDLREKIEVQLNKYKAKIKKV
ncbi:ribosomal subunit interface protein [candidate division CPR3 bacterium GWF2_35_18]|uniref:Ribosomal subunit interface protein n=1 Tax=candidate division CPR3 bacterium GW2011_GWF2_35_18 TaxID=1618350 RepID=A0A0G0BZV1_UNCC3|nr:MAG: hypothetical protein UR67_C0007G0081 [candidate division CPR3 bacterium GW2011_GWF2_35_18]OGB62605.1 MAG: ribosomal subunit interface protein [candidate division CPR3 bacterium GWF2_35_18]OGB65856.1 MAG: ribosomal subunit interface protein [candidate division CPR3 bacterium RIFOXYA2_FULL_35_13]OGB76673.1 MAG: ribosomal subunit interface protein [candidate division CPR3 bacterium RIFOXYC2_FULL_35_7]OGB78832.1 MAG: ribosomal subunit interface protein [candidate division CPR3 bacterium RIF